MLIKEFCAENFGHVAEAIDAGAKRIELCDNLAVGGTTPSYGVIAHTCEYALSHGVAVMTMIRPRGGNFVYSDEEVEMMLDDIEAARSLGSTGVVFGCLTEAGELDTPALERLIAMAHVPTVESERGMRITFHMAFDDMPAELQFDAIDWLSEHGVDRILTHGGPAGTNIDDNIPRLQELAEYAAGSLIILPGAGITYANAEQVASAVGVSEVHGTKIVKLG